MFGQLADLNTWLDQRGPADRANAVVLVYYQGGESLGKGPSGEPYLWGNIQKGRAGRPSSMPTWSVTWRTCPGAHLMVMDVARTPGDMNHPSLGKFWNDDSRFGVLRLAREDGGGTTNDRMIPALHEALGKGPRYAEAARWLAGHYGGQDLKPSSVIFHDWVPRPLADLQLGE